MTSRTRSVVLLGSTGSIGTQAVDVITRNPDRFRVVGLAGGGGNVELLAAQALGLAPDVVAVARASAVQDLQLAFYAAAKTRGYSAGEYRIPRIVAGPDAVAELASTECDVVLNGVSGSVGLAATLAALRAGRTLALANKESLVAGAPLVKALLAEQGAGRLVPVDSEHSALAQCLRGGRSTEVRRLVLTASGGPFRGRTREELADVTPADALAHPTWNMGPLVTVNSATLMNKGLEVIEAHELFDVPYDAIEVVVHPQSIIHSMVEFADGSTLAQASPPDMRLPIALALGWPDRVPDAAPALDWTASHHWEVLPLDPKAFPAVGLCADAGRAGGVLPAVLNASNEECVTSFLDGRLSFCGIVDTVSAVVEEAAGAVARGELPEPTTVADVVAAEQWARRRARQTAGRDTAVDNTAGERTG